MPAWAREQMGRFCASLVECSWSLHRIPECGRFSNRNCKSGTPLFILRGALAPMDAQRRAPTFQQLDPEDYGSALSGVSATIFDLVAVDMDMIEDNLAIMESMGVEAPEKLVDVDFFNRMPLSRLLTELHHSAASAHVMRAFPYLPLSRSDRPLARALLSLLRPAP